MQRLVADAIAAGADTIDADAPNRQIQLYRSAAQVGITQTDARPPRMVNSLFWAVRSTACNTCGRWT
jgi:hypothetical protein